MTNSDSSPSNTETAAPSGDGTLALGQIPYEFLSFEYHAEEGVYRALYSSTENPPSMAVVSAVSAASDMDPCEMNPLHNTIDTDGLNSLATPQYSTEGDIHVVFEYEGYEVTASSYGSLELRSANTGC